MKIVSDKSGVVKTAKPAKPAAKKRSEPREKNIKTGNKKALKIVLIVVLVIVATFFALGAYANGLDTIFPKVSMEGIALGGTTVEQAADKLSAADFGNDDDQELKVNLPAGLEMSVSAKEAGCYLNAPDAAVFVFDRCHGGNFFSNTAAYLRCLFGGLELSVGDGAMLDEDYLHSKVDEAAKQVQLALLESDLEIEDESVSIIKGASAAEIDAEDLYDVVKKALMDGSFMPINYDAVSVGDKVAEIDLQKLYDTVLEEPVNAKYDPETKAATESVNGRSFDMDEAQRLWDAAAVGDKVVIPLLITEPEISTDKLNSMLFAEVLSQKSTSLSGSSSARVNNITRAAAAINGTVLNPGEEFSYNGTVGERTASKGYQGAGAYSGGKVVTEIGGGICQVSSTLYYCTLYANLEITSRLCHMFGVSYLPAGLDATVSWPAPDFKFKNDSEYPIKIEAFVDTSSYVVTVRIHGSNPDGIRVEMTTETWSIPNGYGAVSYRWVYDKDGNLISKKEEDRSQYSYHTDDNDDPAPSASPSPSAEVSPSPSPSGTPTSPTPTPSTPVTPTPTPTTTTPPPTPTTPVDPTPPPPTPVDTPMDW